MLGVVVLHVGEVRIVGLIVECDLRLRVTRGDRRVFEGHRVAGMALCPIVAVVADADDRSAWREHAHTVVEVFLKPGLARDAARLAGVVMLVISHEQRIIDELGIIRIWPGIVVERRSQHDDPAVRRKRSRHFCQENCAGPDRRLEAILRNRRRRPETCYSRRRRRCRSKAHAGAADRPTASPSPGPSQIGIRSILHHRKHGHRWVGLGNGGQRVPVEVLRQREVWPLQIKPRRHEPIEPGTYTLEIGVAEIVGAQIETRSLNGRSERGRRFCKTAWPMNGLTPR